jgi:hypothetical protein
MLCSLNEGEVAVGRGSEGEGEGEGFGRRGLIIYGGVGTEDLRVDFKWVESALRSGAQQRTSGVILPALSLDSRRPGGLAAPRTEVPRSCERHLEVGMR